MSELEHTTMHALAAGRIVGEVMKRVREGDCQTTPKFSNETLEDALLEVNHLFQREQEERERLTAELAAARLQLSAIRWHADAIEKPPFDVRVMVRFDDGEVGFACYTAVHVWKVETVWDYMYRVTHWREIGELPSDTEPGTP